MKRAKLLLLAVALAAVGGAVTAAKSTPAQKIYTSNIPTFWPFCVQINATLEPNSNRIGEAYATEIPAGPCSVFTEFYQAL
ncbi:hypothetical protein [Chitinophaga flava]|uniref:Uncharacterized protein n=1 Tax=Chitinophaga flava TaxID=2259036 RepID=A0A365XTK7_9BACT|nr:hypothetical protein [Chitinophaga flava]RBL89351.1 hypothetical protein DF182_22790 [Chitinophaga flava]